VLDGAGFGLEDWIIAGIDWAVRNGVEVINLSIEGPDAQGLHDACDAAYRAGVILVAAGGNSLAGKGPVEYPAGYASVIAVTATDHANLPAYVSPVGEELELAAPGVDVLSTVAGGGYKFLRGTSQAAPHVTGVVALSILSNTRDINGDGIIDHEDVRLAVQMNAIDLGDAGKDEIYGYGLVDAAAAAFAPETTLLATRTSASPELDAQLIEVTGVQYEISIENSDLKMVTVDVFEGDVLRRDLSNTLHFGARNPQQVVLPLDATGTRHTVLFTPYGKPGASAEIAFRLNPQPGGD